MISLGEISALCSLMINEERELKEMENAVKAKKERIRSLSEESIPCAMQELGLKQMTMTTGEKVEIKSDVYAAIPAGGKAAAFQWLEENNFGGLIKTEISLEFGKGEMDNAVKLVEKLEEEGFSPMLSRDVHAQTLKAFLREQLEKATDVPLDLFGARPVDITKITNPKPSK